MAAARRGHLHRGGTGHHPPCTPNRSDPGGADSVGRLAGGHRGGVQLHERHRASVLHGGARARDRRGHRHRRNNVVAAAAPTSAPRQRWPAPSSSPPSWRRCCCPATATGCPGCGRPSRSGEWVRRCCCCVAGRLPRPVARVGRRRWPWCVVSGRARGLLHRDRGDAAHAARSRRSGPSRDGGPVAASRAGGLLGSPDARAGLTADAGRRRGRLHLGRGGRRLEQRRGLPTGQRCAGDGGRRVQRHRSRRRPSRSSSATSPSGGSTTSSGAG